MPPKCCIEDCRDLARAKGGECLSLVYTNAKGLLQWQCSKSHQWWARFSNVKNRGSWCPHCAGKARLSINDAMACATKMGGKCLSTIYKNNKQMLKWECSEGHQWESHLNTVQQGHWCATCAGNARLTIADAQAEAAKHGGECLSMVYVNNDTPLRWRCVYTCEWDAALAVIRNRGQWCPSCAGKRITIKDMQKLAESKGGKCLSTTYVNMSTPLLWQCLNAHQWETSPHNIKHQDTWCPHCLHKNEANTRQIFEQLTGQSFPETAGLFPEAPLRRLDGFCKELGVAFEYHGEQHYIYVPHFHRNGPEDLKKQQARDKEVETQALYLDNPIALIIVPYWLTMEERKSFVNEELRLLSVLQQ